MDVIFIGAGSVATALAEAAERAGHSVCLVVRDVTSASAQRARARVPSARLASGRAADLTADLWILAVPARAAQQVVVALRLPPGSVLVDATNAFAGVPGEHATMAAAISAADATATVVKAFNVVGAEQMADPARLSVFLPIASDDAAAAELVRSFAASLGFDAVVVGGLDQAVLIEDLARLWAALAFRAGLGRDIAFSLSRGNSR